MPVITETEYLEIGGVPLATPAWVIVDLTPMWEGSEVRGRDRLLPGVAGVKARKRRATVTPKSLHMLIFGERDQDNGVYADPRAGLWTNIAYLRTNVVDPYSTGNGTRTAILHAPGAVTRTGAVHVISPLRLTKLGTITARAVLQLSIPGGALA